MGIKTGWTGPQGVGIGIGIGTAIGGVPAGTGIGIGTGVGMGLNALPPPPGKVPGFVIGPRGGGLALGLNLFVHIFMQAATHAPLAEGSAIALPVLLHHAAQSG